MTTLVTADRLWSTAWLNVLPQSEFEARVPGEPSETTKGAIFPWMAPTRTSAIKGGTTTPPQKVHPLQHLWGLPRRVRLVINSGSTGTCAVSGASSVPIVRSYLNRPDGTSYDGDYRHPWTPYSRNRPNEPWNPKKGSRDGLPYRDWPLLVTGTTQRIPAAAVSYFSAKRRERVAQPRLAAFGYAMDKMKPLRWCRAETPLITIAENLGGFFAADVEALVAASEEVCKTFSTQVKSAWSDRPADLDVFGRVNPAFWSFTEPAFFSAVQAVKSGLEADDQKQRDAAKEAWLESLYRGALTLFDTFVEISADLAAPNLRRAVLARRNLTQFTRPSSPKLRKLLGLLVEESATPAKKAKSRKPRKESTT